MKIELDNCSCLDLELVNKDYAMKDQALSKPAITIIFATDNNYSQHLTVTIVSLIEHNPTEELDLYIILIDVDEKHRANFCQTVANRPLVKLTLVPFDAKTHSQFPVNGHISWATYARIFIPDILPPSAKKALYLDCDLYIADSIRPLWEIDLGSHAVGAVADPMVDRSAALGLPQGSVYYNAGVLLMNIEVWRAKRLVQKISEYINGHISILRFHDQDAINAFLHDGILPIDPRWNAHHWFFEESAARLNLSPEALAELKTRPGIVHFTSDRKPWYLLNNHPYRSHYWRILKTTPYRDYWPPLLSARKALPEKYRVGTLLAKLKGKS